MGKLTRIATLAVAGLVLSGCDLIVSPDRVAEGSGDTITISNGQGALINGCGNDDVDVFMVVGDADPELLGQTTAVDSEWSIDVLAPADRGSYTIFAECGESQTILDQELIVEPEFAPVATPAQYVTGNEPDAISVVGDWCITSSAAFEEFLVALAIEAEPIEEPPPGLPFPTVTGTLGDEELTVVASEHQPFGDDWGLEFAAPTSPGVHQIEITCTFFDFESGRLPIPNEGPGLDAEIQRLAVDVPDFLDVVTKTSVVPIQVDGILETDAESFVEGDSVTVNNATSSPCDGVVTVRLVDGDTTVSKTPAVADDGSWTVSFDDLGVGDPTVNASCEGTEESGTFSYGPVVLSVTEAATPSTTTTTTTTTAPPEGKVAAAAAAPVAAQPAFTG